MKPGAAGLRGSRRWERVGPSLRAWRAVRRRLLPGPSHLRSSAARPHRRCCCARGCARLPLPGERPRPDAERAFRSREHRRRTLGRAVSPQRLERLGLLDRGGRDLGRHSRSMQLVEQFLARETLLLRYFMYSLLRHRSTILRAQGRSEGASATCVPGGRCAPPRAGSQSSAARRRQPCKRTRRVRAACTDGRRGPRRTPCRRPARPRAARAHPSLRSARNRCSGAGEDGLLGGLPRRPGARLFTAGAR